MRLVTYSKPLYSDADMCIGHVFHAALVLCGRVLSIPCVVASPCTYVRYCLSFLIWRIIRKECN